MIRTGRVTAHAEGADDDAALVERDAAAKGDNAPCHHSVTGAVSQVIGI